MEERDKNAIYRVLHTINASECNAQQIIPLSRLVQWLIEAATDHSSLLGVGPRHLAQNNRSWVLSRLNMVIYTPPRMHTSLIIETWVADINRHFTERCFRMTGDGGEVLGYARTIWMAIDIATRRAVDMSAIMACIETHSFDCPIDGNAKIPPVKNPQSLRRHRFLFSDIDFNRHVNSTRYIDCVLNDRSVDFFDCHEIKKFEIAYMAETHYDDEVHIARETSGCISTVEITRNGQPVTRCRITYDRPVD